VVQRRLRVRSMESFACLVEVRRGDPAKPPLFLVCWEGGRLVGYHDLVERLPRDQPVYGLRAPAFDGRTSRFGTLEELAAIFVGELRRFRPEPPYLLAGFCFGGTLAHEVALQLEAQDVSVAYLGLIESSPYGHGRPKRARPPQRERKAAWLRTFVGEEPSRKARMVWDYLFGRWSWWRRPLRKAAYATAVRTGWRWPGRIFNLNLITIRAALRSYVVTPSNARVTLFEGHDPAGPPLEPTVWARLAGGGVDLRVIPASGFRRHAAIMREPYIDDLARAFVEALGTSACPRRERDVSGVV
jgi:thioesterase domain-containing protein